MYLFSAGIFGIFIRENKPSAADCFEVPAAIGPHWSLEVFIFIGVDYPDSLECCL